MIIHIGRSYANLFHATQFNQMCLDWNKLCKLWTRDIMCTLDVHHKSQHFVRGDNHNLLNFFGFYSHDCNIKIWTCYCVQISNHISWIWGDANIICKIGRCCVTKWTCGHWSCEDNLCCIIINNNCKTTIIEC